MKHLLPILILLIIPKVQKEEIKQPSENTHITHFPSVYATIRKYEGNYVYHPHDKGGETYGGVARKYCPDWYGWRYIRKDTKRYERVEAAELWVMDHYLDIWVKEGFDQIKDYDLALNTFDFRINSSPRTYSKKVSKILNDMGECDIHSLNSEEFVWRLKIERILLYTHLALNDSTQRTFYRGWIKRLGV